VADHEIMCVGLSEVPGGHLHITQIVTDLGTKGWEINQVLARMIKGDRFYTADPQGRWDMAFPDVCSCGFESIRTVDGGYGLPDYLDLLPPCL
jgi:hypothetical protein